MQYIHEDLSRYRKNDVNKKIDIIGTRPVDVMITGATGAGKSTTLNALIQRTAAKIGEGADPQTKDIKSYELNEFVRLWDTPGLGDGISEDKAHIKKITSLLRRSYCTSNGNKYGFIDMVLVIADGSVRDMGTLFNLIDTIKPYISPTRILVAVNQADFAIKGGSHWDEKRALPDEYLKNFFNERAFSIKRRIEESCGINVPMLICYSAMYGYNIKSLLDILIDRIPSSRRDSVQ